MFPHEGGELDWAPAFAGEQGAQDVLRGQPNKSGPLQAALAGPRITLQNGVNPAGGVHEQGKAKISEKGGRLATYVHEYVINTFVPVTDFAVAVADAYWAKTKDYWSAVCVECASRPPKGWRLRLEKTRRTGRLRIIS